MFTATAFDKRPVIATISSCRAGLEAYWETLGEAALGVPPAELNPLLSPLDAFLFQMLLESGPKGLVVADMAAGDTFGATTATALVHPTPQRVLAWMNRGSDTEEIAEALRQYARRSDGGPRLEFLASDDLPANLVARKGLFVVVDSRTADPAALAKAVKRWQSTHPDSVIVVLGIGPVGESEALDELLNLCRADTGRRLWLVRELADAVISSQLVVIARTGLELAETAIRRIVLSYTGNIRYLELLCDLNTSAIRKTDSDHTALWAHPSGSPVLAEIEALKQQIHAAREEAEGVQVRVRSLESLAYSEAIAHQHFAAAYGEMVLIANAQTALVEQRTQELATIHASFGFRAGLRLDRVRRLLAPNGSYRHRCLRKMRRGLQILRGQGVGALLKRIVKGPSPSANASA